MPVIKRVMGFNELLASGFTRISKPFEECKNMKNLVEIKKLISGGIIGLAITVLVQNANALLINDANYLGYAYDGTPADPSSVSTYLDGVIGLALGGSGTADGNSIFRSNNNFGTLTPDASGASGKYTDFGSGTTSIDVTGLMYVSAHFGNNGQQFWYVGNLTGTVTLPASYVGLGDNGGGISGVLGYKATPPTTFTPSLTSAPDGGSTGLLLGSVLSVMGLVVRRPKR